MKKTVIFVIICLAIVVPLSAVVATANSCVDCHSESAVTLSEKEEEFHRIRLQHLDQERACSIECHEDFIKRLAKQNFLSWKMSKHGIGGITCDRCHLGDSTKRNMKEAHIGIQTSQSPESKLYYQNLPDACGECHSPESDSFKKSLHYTKLETTGEGPTCATCHNIHDVEVLSFGDIPEKCAICHNERLGHAPEVTQEVEIALSKLLELQQTAINLKVDIQKNKVAGKETSVAEYNLNSINKILSEVPEYWHSFDLATFDNRMDLGQSLAKTEGSSESDAESDPKSKPTTATGQTIPGFAGLEAVMAVMGIVSVLYLARRRI